MIVELHRLFRSEQRSSIGSRRLYCQGTHMSRSNQINEPSNPPMKLWWYFKIHTTSLPNTRPFSTRSRTKSFGYYRLAPELMHNGGKKWMISRISYINDFIRYIFWTFRPHIGTIYFKKTWRFMKIHRRPHKGSGLIVQRFKTANPSVYVYLAERQQNRYMHETASKARVSQSALSIHIPSIILDAHVYVV